MRLTLALAAVMLLAACSTPGNASSSGTPSASSSTSASVKADPKNPCTWLSQTEVEALMSDKSSGSQLGQMTGIPQCTWPGSSSTKVIVTGGDASLWAKALPPLVAQIQASGAASAKVLKPLTDAVKQIVAGKGIKSAQACDLFSHILELQGKPAGSTEIVTVSPSETNAQVVTSQICADGMFTSVTLVNSSGFGSHIPINEVQVASEAAHRRAVG